MAHSCLKTCKLLLPDCVPNYWTKLLPDQILHFKIHLIFLFSLCSFDIKIVLMTSGLFLWHQCYMGSLILQCPYTGETCVLRGGIRCCMVIAELPYPPARASQCSCSHIPFQASIYLSESTWICTSCFVGTNLRLTHR